MTKKILITGGAGFIGSNYACRRILNGDEVTIFDNLSRDGAKENLQWIASSINGKPFQFVEGDVRDFNKLKETVEKKDIIVHLAAQVAVTSSVNDPQFDFNVNAGGTFNVLESARQCENNPIIIYASTNKVYGEIEGIEVKEDKSRYSFEQLPLGISEKQLLDFHSPYGCSKGCGDQYVRDYSRIYNIPTVVFRQSCIYGTRQFGIEDQGWVAWFVIAAVLGKQVSIYGDGKQVRDLLFINDLLNVYDLAIEKIDKAQGQIFNIGGGIENSISIWKEFGPILEKIHGKNIPIEIKGWRPGDQKIYISDISKAK
ncbi:MAG: GDP-mannose 4,6-dehydratase, partial [Pelolinea sp.]|nr:GDP-mannose 4,6-dehydratase [Pelolinea sp.]